MASLSQLRKTANKYGGTVVIGEYNLYDQSTVIEIEAPDGKQWQDGNCQVILEYFWSYIKDSRAEAYDNLIERMSYGLENLESE